MSSGRRPGGSASPSAWRSMSMSKKTAPASLSLIFAEPEQGAPLGSAATKLPPAAYKNDNMMRKRDWMESTLTVQDDCKDSTSLSSGSTKRFRVDMQPDTQPDASPDSLHSDQNENATKSTDVLHTVQLEGLTDVPSVSSNITSDPTENLCIPFPSAPLTELTPAPKPSSSGSSWFGPLSRAKGKDQAPVVLPPDENTKKADGPTVEGQVLSVDANAPQHVTQLAPMALTPEPQPQPSTPQQIPAQREATRGWFSSSPSAPTPTVPRPPLSPTSPTSPNSQSHSNSMASIPSSIDEEVPRLSVVTPPNTPGPASITPNAGGNIAKLSSLNPSTSRFTFSIPLLGRPKMPLDQVVAVVVAEDGGKGGTDQAAQGPSVIVEQADEVQQTTTSMPNHSSDLSSEYTPDQQDKSVPNAVGGEVRESSSTSWWGYVGWSKSSGDLPELKAPSNEPPSSASPPTSDARTIRAVKSDPQLPASSQTITQLEGIQRKSAGDSSVSTDVQGASHAKDKAQSLLSSGPAQTPSTAAWYVPWAWYEGSSAKGDGLAGGSKEANANEEAVMTQSEKVKEEALARDHGSAPNIEVTSPTPTVSPAKDRTNPIESTIASNTSGWASFFSSRSLAAKNITDGKDGTARGMEVMDIDEDEGTPDSDPAPAPTAPPGTVATSDGKAEDQARVLDVQLKVVPKVPLPDPKSPDKPRPEKPQDEKPKTPTLPLTNSESIKRDTPKTAQRKISPTPSNKSGNKSPASPRNPNLILPAWADTFHTAPRSIVPSPPSSAVAKTFNFVSGVLFPWDADGGRKGKGRARDKEFVNFGKELPKAFDVFGKKLEPDVLRGCRKAVIIGVHGWFPGAVMRTVLGDPTGTSGKFVDMMLLALDEFQEKHDVKLTKITKIPLEGEGTINKRVDKLYNNLLANKGWMDDIHAADVIFVATHSQGSVVSTHLLDRLIRDGHIRTFRRMEATRPTESLALGTSEIGPPLEPQKICCLALCGIHLGPLRYLSTSSLLQPYFQYFESAAARELFEFQDTESEVSKQYATALANIVHHGTKMVYVASLNDQVVPLYSGLFITASHPLILRALYIDGDAYQSSDFLSNLLVLLLRVLNSGISDSGLLAHLSEATAGSLNGVGHSTAYEELATYSLAVDYCFLANDGLGDHPDLVVDSFDAKNEQNDYEIPWALRDLIADERVTHFFSKDIVELRDAFREWHPKTTILRDIKKKLQPIQRLPSAILRDSGSVSKL